MKKEVLITLTLFLFLCSCAKKRYLIIEKMDRDTSISIKTGRRSPTTLKIKVTGFANDTFAINTMEIPGGKVDTVLISDWYDKTYFINYKAKKASKGKIKIESTLF